MPKTQHPSYHPNLDKPEPKGVFKFFCQNNTKIRGKNLKILYTFFEMIPKQWNTYDKKCKQINEGCRFYLRKCKTGKE